MTSQVHLIGLQLNERNDDTSFLQFLHQCKSENFLTDITIKAGNVTICAHRLVLSYFSRFFKAMFQTNMKERYQDVVVIKEFDGHLLKELIDFMYTDQISLNNENVMELLATADYLQHGKAKQICIEFLENAVSVDNCFIVLAAANKFGSNSTETKVSHFILMNLDQLSTEIDFKTLQKDEVVLCLSNITKFEIKHKSIYKALLTWIKHDFESRSSYFPELFKLISLTRLSTAFLEFNVLKETLVVENLECFQIAQETLNVQLKGYELSDQTKLVSMGGEKTGSKIFTVFTLTSVCNPSVEYPDLPYRVCAFAAVLFNNKFYCIGGCVNSKSSNISNKVYVLDLEANELRWHEVASMNNCRCDLGASVFQNHIVVAGAWHNLCSKSTAESYTQEVNKWRNLSSMKVCRSGLQLVVCQGSLYAIGGKNDRSGFESSVEKLDSLDEEWSFVSSMNFARGFFAAVQCKQYIYALGGHDSSNILQGVEMYDPSVDQWSIVSNMKFSRFDHGACVMQEKIYVVGGSTKRGLPVVTKIECYAPNNDLWSVVDDSLHSLHRYVLLSL